MEFADTFKLLNGFSEKTGHLLMFLEYVQRLIFIKVVFPTPFRPMIPVKTPFLNAEIHLV